MAAFINAIAEEGTKDEAVKWLQKTWDELMEVKVENAKLREALSPFAAHAAHVTGLTYTVPALWMWNARAALQKDSAAPQDDPVSGGVLG